MKKLIILLAICTLSSVVFADNIKPKDILLQTIPGARAHNTVVADATDTASESVTSSSPQKTTTKKSTKHKHKTSKKKSHQKHKKQLS